MTAFDDALAVTLKWEGGLVDDPRDPGGITQYGISQRAHPTRDIESLTLGEARDIYRDVYWNAVRGDELPLGVSLVVFDCAVNLGPVRAIRFLQLASGAAADGVFGPKTMTAVARKPARDLIADITARRCLHYANLDNGAFLWGWLRRTCDVLTHATDR